LIRPTAKAADTNTSARAGAGELACAIGRVGSKAFFKVLFRLNNSRVHHMLETRPRQTKHDFALQSQQIIRQQPRTFG
jgi:hypothetical protein